MTVKQFIYDYDPESDELTMTLGDPQPSIAREIGDEFFVQLNPETHEVVGFTVLGFGKRALAMDHSVNRVTVPVKLQGQLQLAV